MSANTAYKAYPRYIQSGVLWLGDVPAHWQVARSRRFFSQRKERARPADQQLTASQKHGIILQKDFIEAEGQKVVEVITGADILKHVEPDDFVISMRSFQGGLEWSGLQGSISSAYVMLIPSPAIDPKYFKYAFKSRSYIQVLQSTSNLVRDGQALRFENFTQVDVPLFPIYEQRAIASFLDRETAKIDELIAKQERLIELLAEKRRAVISHAVTKGLDLNVPMKDSGIDWIGSVPTHWEVLPLKRVTLDRCDGPFGSGLKSEHYSDSGVRVIRLQNIRRGSFDGTDEAFIDAAYAADLFGHDVRAGDVLVAGLGDERNSVGRACVAPPDIGPAIVKADCFRFRLDTRRIRAQFAAAQLAAGSDADAGRMSSGSTRSRIPLSAMGSRMVTLPPTPEQILICKHLTEVAAVIDEIAAKANQSIELMKERRSALISAAVTGKIDVREVA